LREWRSGSAIASQAMGRGFESRLPLQEPPGQAWRLFSEILQSNGYGTTQKSAKLIEIGPKSIVTSQAMDRDSPCDRLLPRRRNRCVIAAAGSAAHSLVGTQKMLVPYLHSGWCRGRTRCILKGSGLVAERATDGPARRDAAPVRAFEDEP